MTNPELDTFTTLAQNKDLTPQKKIEDLKAIMKVVQTGMLTTRDKNGNMHSRAMTPASPHSETQLTLYFVANNCSKKFDELGCDKNVNVSFYDEKTTNWASFSGVAKVTQDREEINKHWSTLISSYFGDLKDGIHKGDEHDPRVSIIEVVPNEICYWVATQGTVARAVGGLIDTVTGKTNVPGELRTITKSEIQLTQGLHSK
ncbi:protein related to blue-light-inducible Bli-3 [Pyrrhoderma noxium]|uniref:Protein related to blue-light-inducible Bli-3 n=1 Tax=Pyrrhoderma noxium TaxID=2282107 RepID=A0A286UHF9_9AGAM|nr:protein related to blue-light-inducible Bli-3 [Pyrrhoderma noxium]